MKNQKFRTKRICVLCALALALLLSLTGCGKEDPKAAVKSATTATVTNLTKIGEQLELGEIRSMAATGSYHGEMELYLKEADVGTDLSGFYGSGFSVSMDSDIQNRKISANMGLRVADYDAMNMKLFLLDNTLYFTCPELTGGHLLGINTETLSQDLPDANIDDSENFNYFEMISEHTDENGKFTLSADTLKAMKDAYDAMSDASTWATAEETELTVADISGKCKTYTLTIPAEEARNFLLNMMTALFNDDYCSKVLQGVLSEELYYYDSYEQYVEENLDELKASLEEELTQDVTAVFYVKDKMLRGVDFTLSNDETLMAFELRFGMDKNPADYIGLTVRDENDEELRMVSSGDHIMNAGKFTDKTTVTFKDSEAEETILTLDTDYDAESGAYIVELSLDPEGDLVTVRAAGNLSIDGKTMELTFDSIHVITAEADVAFGGKYSVSESAGVEADVTGAEMISDMTEEAQEELGTELENNITILILTLANRVPAIADMLGMGY